MRRLALAALLALVAATPSAAVAAGPGVHVDPSSPTGKEYADLTSVTTPDRYSIAYLDVLTRANPEEIELRLVYVKQLGPPLVLARVQDRTLDGTSVTTVNSAVVPGGES